MILSLICKFANISIFSSLFRNQYNILQAPPTAYQEIDEESVVMPPPLMTSTPRGKMASPDGHMDDTVDILVVGGFMGKDPSNTADNEDR